MIVMIITIIIIIIIIIMNKKKNKSKKERKAKSEGNKINYQVYNLIEAQLTFTCSKSTIETQKGSEICLKLTIKTPERCQ